MLSFIKSQRLLTYYRCVWLPDFINWIERISAYFSSRLFILGVGWNNFPISCWLSPFETQTSITPCYFFHTYILWRRLFEIIFATLMPCWVVQILVWLLDRYVCHGHNGVARTVSNVCLTIALSSFQKIVSLPKWYSFDSYSTMTDFDANNWI